MPAHHTAPISDSDLGGQMEVMEVGIKRARAAAEASRRTALAERTAREALEREQRHAEVPNPPPPCPPSPWLPQRRPRPASARTAPPRLRTRPPPR
jgi:hypothetical protein